MMKMTLIDALMRHYDITDDEVGEFLERFSRVLEASFSHNKELQRQFSKLGNSPWAMAQIMTCMIEDVLRGNIKPMGAVFEQIVAEIKKEREDFDDFSYYHGGNYGNPFENDDFDEEKLDNFLNLLDNLQQNAQKYYKPLPNPHFFMPEMPKNCQNPFNPSNFGHKSTQSYGNLGELLAKSTKIPSKPTKKPLEKVISQREKDEDEALVLKFMSTFAQMSVNQRELLHKMVENAERRRKAGLK